MSLEQTLGRFNEQFDWDPVIINESALGTFSSYLVSGMGGSHLGAWLIDRFGSGKDILIHRGYGLPAAHDLDRRLCIASSYSGTTEETIDALDTALSAGLSSAVIAKGGALIERAHEKSIAHIVLPDAGLEPRMAIGYSMLALARLMQDRVLEDAIRSAGKAVDPHASKEAGAALAERLKGKIPLIWASHHNLPLAYIWKVKFNETSKIPCFCDYFPELSHNEFTGFDVQDSTRSLASQLVVVMLHDANDHPRIQKRMQLSSDMLGERGIGVEHVTLSGTGFAKAFDAALLADWAALPLALHYNVPNPETPLIAEFKKRMAQ